MMLKLFIITIIFINIVALWKIFEKSGQKGWFAIIPIFNFIILLRIINKPWWWTIIVIIPYVGYLLGAWVTFLLSRNFGKSDGFCFLSAFFPFIYLPILGFSNSSYMGTTDSSL